MREKLLCRVTSFFLVVLLGLILTGPLHAVEVSNHSGSLRLWYADWTSDFLDLDQDFLYSLIYGVNLDKWLVNFVVTFGDYDGTLDFDGTKFDRERFELEVFTVYPFELGPGSLGVGGGWRYFDLDDSFIGGGVDSKFHGPTIALSYNQTVDADNNWLLSGSYTIMPVLFVEVDDSTIPGDGDGETWGWNAQVAVTRIINDNWLATFGYKYQIIEKETLKAELFFEEEFDGFFLEVRGTK